MKNSIKIYFQGGLGNQLFQFSTSYLLAKKKKFKLYFNTNGYENSSRSFELNKFHKIKNLKFPIIKKTDLKLRIKRYLYKKLIYFLKITKLEDFYFNLNNGQNKILSPDQIILEISPYVFNSKIFNQNLPSNFTLVGFYQSEKYFVNNRMEILNLLKFPKSKNKRFSYYLNKIKNNNSVAIHVRRGDYKSKELSNYFDVLSDRYYLNAINYLKKRLINPKMFVFSDDVSFVKKYPIFQNNCDFVNTDSSIDDLHLMSNCKHFIIANSSYSWWGAWLSKNKTKIVCAPNVWIKEKIITKDIIPDNWKKINIS